MNGQHVSAPSLPPELWLYIHRLVVSDLSPLGKLYATGVIARWHNTAQDYPLNDSDNEELRDLLKVCPVTSVFLSLTHDM